MNPQILNPDGYFLLPNLEETQKQKKQCYDFRLRSIAPVQFWDGDRLLQPNKNVVGTDLGSIPNCVSWMPGLSKDDWEISYCFHDSGRRDNGFWCSGKFVHMTVAEIDALLRQMIPIEADLKKRGCCGWLAALPVWAGVRIGSWFGIGIYKEKYR